MPLSKKRMRDRKKQDRQTQVKPTGLQEVSNPNQDKLAALRKMMDMADSSEPVESELLDKAEQEALWRSQLPALRKLMDMPTMNSMDSSTGRAIEASEPVNQPPIFNPKKHHEGDVVRKWSNGKWVEVTVPALDMDGNVIGGM